MVGEAEVIDDMRTISLLLIVLEDDRRALQRRLACNGTGARPDAGLRERPRMSGRLPGYTTLDQPLTTVGVALPTGTSLHELDAAMRIDR